MTVKAMTSHWPLTTIALKIISSEMNIPDGGMARMQIIPVISTIAPAG